MVDAEIEKKLEKLARLEISSKDSSKRYINKMKEKGKVQISAIISTATHNAICKIRDAALLKGQQITTGQIIDNLLSPDVNTEINIAINPEINIDKIKSKEPEYSLFESEKMQDAPGPVIDQGETLTREEKDAIIIKVVESYPGRINAQKRPDVLNQAGVPCVKGKSKGLWNAKNTMDAYRRAIKRLDNEV